MMKKKKKIHDKLFQLVLFASIGRFFGRGGGGEGMMRVFFFPPPRVWPIHLKGKKWNFTRMAGAGPV